ncbi:type II restriction endonuclease [Thalassobacillus devorans]|uniref:Type II restriction endonuclease n=1 Tax=Thalassobacillus devorans TaxID=279813 RepID=A0ABQ1PI19_9BACI|nr:type II restriction endonuclease [Thalassobacillus devorans]NIK30018.1 type II restriction enzyme [Thalassobacillus devorans]GGC97681.1 type II restriction endonuclease [Thalassobacillus devorans]
MQRELDNLPDAIEAARQNGRFFCKFLTPNDAGVNGAHQDGVYLNIGSWDIFFNEVSVPATGIRERLVMIHIDGWQPFESRIVYYTSKKEFRITRFWSNAPFNRNEMVGALIIFIPLSKEDYKVYIFNTEEEIEEFSQTFSLSLADNYTVYHEDDIIVAEETFEDKVLELVAGYKDFPETAVMAEISRRVYMEYYSKKKIQPDKDLINWVDTEYTVFRLIEQEVYKDKLIRPFGELQPLLDFASSALNRRKSRAGRSLEHHINYILTNVGLPFDNPGKTEGEKKPDFLLPSTNHYHNPEYPQENLILLGVKTTCKDRWRQVLSEGERIPNKHLLTLQQGISENQLKEMENAHLQLVVPKPYHKQYPEAYKEKIWSVSKFIDYANEKYTLV